MSGIEFHKPKYSAVPRDIAEMAKKLGWKFPVLEDQPEQTEEGLSFEEIEAMDKTDGGFIVEEQPTLLDNEQ